MQRDQPTLLLTRSKAQSERFAEEFRARFGAGWRVVLSPLAETVWLAPALPAGPVPHVIFTSENGVHAYARLTAQRGQTAWCVGERTGTAARQAGFRDLRIGGGDARALCDKIIASGEVGRALYLRPVHAAAPIEDWLNSAGTETLSAVVYDQRALSPTPEALALVEGCAPVLLPLFSVRSAERAVAVFGALASAPLYVAPISAAVERAARALGATKSLAAKRTDAASVLDSLAALAEAAKTG